MKFGPWFSRLNGAIDEALVQKRFSLRSLSMKAGYSPNYVGQMRRDTKGPSAEAVVRLAAALDVSLTWIFLGVEMSPSDERLLALAASLSEDQKSKLLELLQSVGSTSQST